MDLKLLLTILLSSLVLIGIGALTWWSSKESAKAEKNFKEPPEMQKWSKVTQILGAATLIGLILLLLSPSEPFVFLFLTMLGTYFATKGYFIIKAKVVHDIDYSLFGKAAQVEGTLMAGFGAFLILVSILSLALK